MQLYRIIFTLGLLFLLIGCNTDATEDSTGNKDNNIELTKIAANHPVDQQPSNQAKEALSQQEGLTSVKAVNNSEKLLIAIDTKHHERFRLAKTRKQLTKDMKRQFSNMEVEFSTDKKINLELEKLENQILKGSISKKKLDKKIDQLIKLAKEKT